MSVKVQRGTNHSTRRREMLRAHPEIKTLMGNDTHTFWKSMILVLLQMYTSFHIHKFDIYWYMVICYFWGATITQSLFLAVHESCHNLIFRSIKYNKLFSLVLNIPIVIPFSSAFRHYHLDHHAHQGITGMDTDLPTELERRIVTRPVFKYLWLMFQLVFYALRPFVCGNHSLKIDKFLIYNIVLQIITVTTLYYTHGHTPFVYLLTCDLLAGGIHPTAGHFLSEHYDFYNTGQETFSYYGILNKVTWNVGYHNEHHDFPSVPGSRLPQITHLAPEYYDKLPTCKSWWFLLYKFLTDSNTNLDCRIVKLA